MHLKHIVFIHGLLEHHVLMVTSGGNTRFPCENRVLEWSAYLHHFPYKVQMLLQNKIILAF